LNLRCYRRPSYSEAEGSAYDGNGEKKA
jgi:hypothetical protein